ncbi:MarR family transcriptional regulator [Halorhodospira halophila]|uniref:MarR family transcriptional regulator n=1 Tax=Halorhodospira halophila TaxID=1053 RepID=UPI00191448E1|nr:helix-turn-helix domain-containing protein [Halorhodospira halophila]
MTCEVQTPATRKHDPASSHHAEREITGSGARAAQQRQAAEAVRQNPGVTSSELARRSGIDRHTLGRRLPECETAGAVIRGTQVRDPETGRLGVSWWPAEYTQDHHRRDCLDAERICRMTDRRERRRALAKIHGDRGEEAAGRVRRLVEQIWSERKGRAANAG